MKNKVIGIGKTKRVSKSPWECVIRKWVKDVQGKQMVKDAQEERIETKEPTSNVMG